MGFSIKKIKWFKKFEKNSEKMEKTVNFVKILKKLKKNIEYLNQKHRQKKWKIIIEKAGKNSKTKKKKTT